MIGTVSIGPMGGIILAAFADFLDWLWHVLSDPTAPEWLVAFGTILLAVAAVFQERIRTWIWHPSFEFEIEMGPPFCNKIPCDWRDNQFYAYYCMVRVWNRGKAPARGVTVFATSLEKLEKKDDIESGKPVREFLPMELKWAHVRDPLTGKRFIEKQIISRDLFAHFDIGCVEPYWVTDMIDVDRRIDRQPDEVVFKIDTFITPNTLSNLLPKGQYLLHVKASASNVRKPKEQVFLNSHIGQWEDDQEKMFNKDNLNIEIIDN